MLHVLLVFVGGGVGSLLRHAASSWLQDSYGKEDMSRFPIGTLAVNIVGCLLIGLLASWCGRRELMRFLVLVGVLGGFTTFSSFGLETIRLLNHGMPLKALIYVLATNFAALAAVWIGYGGHAETGLPVLGTD